MAEEKFYWVIDVQLPQQTVQAASKTAMTEREFNSIVQKVPNYVLDIPEFGICAVNAPITGYMRFTDRGDVDSYLNEEAE